MSLYQPKDVHRYGERVTLGSQDIPDHLKRKKKNKNDQYEVAGRQTCQPDFNNFLQEVDEEGNPKKESRSVIMERYLRSTFTFDVIIFLPIGYFMSLIDQKLKFFWVIKAVRIMKVNYYVSNRIILPLIVQQIVKR